MAAGDGIADIIGRHVFDDSLLKVDANPLLTEPLNWTPFKRDYRRFGTAKWPFSEKKSYIGSAAFVVGAFVVCATLLSYLSANGFMPGFDVVKKLPELFVISVICALVELIPVGRWREIFRFCVLQLALSSLLFCFVLFIFYFYPNFSMNLFLIWLLICNSLI